jgi:hypothetical protein
MLDAAILGTPDKQRDPLRRWLRHTSHLEGWLEDIRAAA